MGAESDEPTAGAGAAKRRRLIYVGVSAIAFGVGGALVDYWVVGTYWSRFAAFFHLVVFTFMGLALIGWTFLPPADNADLDDDIRPPNSGRM